MKGENIQPIRIIPRLDIKGSKLVKGIRLEGLRILGEPEEFSKFYYENGADELFFQDVVASLYERNSLFEIIQKTAKEVFIPLSVGGGIRTLDNIYQILRSGADKVCINTAALINPSFIKEASNHFGSSTISVSIEAIKQPSGDYLAFSDNGRNCSEKNVIEWAKEVEDLGAGEIVITTVDNEGTGIGFDEELIRRIVNHSSLPIVVHGGAGNKNHIYNLISKFKISGIAIASLFHYERLKENDTSKEDLKFKNSYNLKHNINIETISVNELKRFLLENDINCRLHD